MSFTPSNLDVAGVGAFPAGVAVTGAVDSQWSPNLYNLKSWTFDPVAINTQTAPTSGVLNIMAMRITKATTINHLYMNVSTVGATVSAAYAALYTSAGALLVQSDNQSANMATLGMKTFTFVPQAVTAGWLYAAFWATATTPPAYSRATGIGAMNSLLGTSYRFATTSNTGLTTTAPATLGVATALSVGYWAGLD